MCQEDIHTSRIPSQIPPCNHLIHKTCFDDMVSHGQFACPVCGVSMMNMADVWGVYDQEIAETPMPEEYCDLLASPSPLTSIAHSGKESSSLAGGCYSGSVCCWDIRADSRPVSSTSFHHGHTQPVYKVGREMV